MLPAHRFILMQTPTTRQITPHVPWIRYWTPEGRPPSLNSAGFFADPYYRRRPSDLPVRITNHEARTLDELADRSCLVLLGEPGAGKTTELEHLDEPDALKIDLGRIAGEVGFHARVSNHPRLLAWKERGEPLTLILDAYDELFLRIDTAAALLEDAITSDLPTDHAVRRARARELRLRVTSRGGVWRPSTTAAFESLWEAPNVGVYALTPLRQADVVQAAETWGLPPDAFWSAVHQSGVETLGAFPLTLTWLLDTYRDQGALPGTWRETFDLAIRRLCTEQNPGRLNADRDGHCTPDQRVAFAGRLAALMRFGDRAVLELRSNGETEEDVILGTEAYGDERDTNGTPFQVDREALRDLARDTTLFQRAEPDRYRWTQASIADYLAAWYLGHSGASLRQMVSLLTDPDDGRVVPQLVSVAAVAAALDPDVFLALAERDPGVALGAAGVHAHPEAVRRQGVDLYLQAVGEQRLHVFLDPTPTSFRNVAHPGLADQLAAWIADPDRPEDARQAAVRIAGQNGLTGLADLVRDLALDEQAPLDLRTTAVYAVEWIGTSDDVAQLRPLLDYSTPGEGGERLRFAAQSVLWPDHLSVRDLVQLESAASGPADAFARDLQWRRLFPDDLALDRLVELLDWIAEDDPVDAPGLISGALTTAASRSGNDEVGRRLAPLLVRYASDDGVRISTHPVKQALAEHEGERTEFLIALVDALSESDRRTLLRGHHRFAPVRIQDGIPLLTRLTDDTSSATHDTCTALLQMLVTPSDDGPRGELWVALQRAASESQTAADIVAQAIADSQLRQAHQPQSPDPLDPPIPERIEADLAASTPDDWQRAAFTLTLDPDHSPPRHSSNAVLSPSALPAWTRLTPEQCDSVADAAEAYVAAAAPDDSDWRFLKAEGTRTVALADGVRALALLHRLRSPIPDDTLAAWVPALLFRWALVHGEETDSYALLKRAYRVRPGAVRDTMRRLLTVERFDIGPLVRPLGILDDAELDQLLFEALTSGKLHEAYHRTALEGLLRRNAPGATEYAASQVETAEEVADAAWGAFLLFITQPTEAWTRYADRVRDDDEFACCLLGQIADKSREGALPTHAPVEALVELERRLHALHDPENDPARPEEVYSPSREDRIRDLRGGFARTLAAQGTDDAINAIRSLHDVLSDDTLRFLLMRARQRRREENRQAIAPRALLDLLRDRSARLARSADELFAVVTEALATSFETWLRSPSAPRVYALWNRVPRAEALKLAASVLRHDGGADTLADDLDTHRERNKKGGITSLAFPHDENTLSDAALRFLRERLGPGGIIVDREVEIQPGHAPDLLVSLPASEHGPQATVVVEVKGSWHKELYPSVGSQLDQGYLDDVTLRHGVYLVGWYGPEEWYDVAPGTPHPKAKLAQRKSLSAMRARLETKAATAERQVAVVVVDASHPPTRAS